MYEVHSTRVTPFLVEFLLRDFLSISPDHTHFALPLPQCDLATDDLPRLSCAVLAKAPFLELPLILAFPAAKLAIRSSFVNGKGVRTSSRIRGRLSCEP
jgi:hypothetical protein